MLAIGEIQAHNPLTPLEEAEPRGLKMHFEWHEEKRLSNLEKHGIDFEDAIAIWENYTIEFMDLRQDYNGEIRVISFGMLDGCLLAVVFTQRGDIRRIISARKANARERRKHCQAITGQSQNRPN